MRNHLVRTSIAFALTCCLAAAGAAQPLPAGGGEPGKVYLAMQKAIADGNMAALKTTLATPRVKQMEQDKDAAKMLEMIKMMQPTKVKIVSGAQDGKTATLKLEGEQMGEKAFGTASFVMEGSAWKVDKESWSNKPQP